MEAVQSLGSPMVASICRERSSVNLVEATPKDYSPWESMMKLLQDHKAIFDEPEHMQQDIDSPHEPTPIVEDHLCAEFIPTMEHWCIVDASSFEIKEGIVGKHESLALRVVSEFEHSTKELVMDLAPVTDNLGVEEIVV